MSSVGTITRERLADKAQRSVKTLRRWEQIGLLPQPVSDGVVASYEEAELIPGRKFSEVIHVILQGTSLIFIMSDDTCIYMKTRNTVMDEKWPKEVEQYKATPQASNRPESSLSASETNLGG